MIYFAYMQILNNCTKIGFWKNICKKFGIFYFGILRKSFYLRNKYDISSWVALNLIKLSIT